MTFAANAQKSDKAIYDSVLTAYNKLPQNIERFKFLEQLEHTPYEFKEWYAAIVRLAIKDAIYQHNPDKVMLLNYYLFCHYYLTSDAPNMRKVVRCFGKKDIFISSIIIISFLGNIF
jgi:hypothetical protein